MMPESFESLRKMTRDQLKQLVRDNWTDARIWIQENGEVALLAGFVAGILLVLAFKLVFFIAVLAAVAAFALWQCAPEGSRESHKSEFGAINGDGADKHGSDEDPIQ